MDDNNHIVYSTDPEFFKRKSAEKQFNPPPPEKQTLLIRLERKKRRGKTVTVITGIQSDGKSLKKALQKLCHSGGTFKENQIELQGDHREQVTEYLKNLGYKVKISG